MWTNENRDDYDRGRLRYPSDLTDAEIEARRFAECGYGPKHTATRSSVRVRRSQHAIRLWQRLRALKNLDL